MTILLLNAGSSSLKFTLMAPDESILVGGSADWSGDVTHYEFTGPDSAKHREDVPWRGSADATRRAIADLQQNGLDPDQLTAVGHRWVHGGGFTGSVRVTPEVQAKLAALSDLAPLHNPPSLNALLAARESLPEVPHVAAFDTAFHATLPPQARTYPVPRQWTEDWGLRRYGFHGLSYAWCAERAAQMLVGKSDLPRAAAAGPGGAPAGAAAGRRDRGRRRVPPAGRGRPPHPGRGVRRAAPPAGGVRPAAPPGLRAAAAPAAAPGVRPGRAGGVQKKGRRRPAPASGPRTRASGSRSGSRTRRAPAGGAR